MKYKLELPPALYRGLGACDVVLEPTSLRGFVDRYNLGDSWLMHCPAMNATFPMPYDAKGGCLTTRREIGPMWFDGMKYLMRRFGVDLCVMPAGEGVPGCSPGL